MKHLILGMIMLGFLASCSEDIIENGYKIKVVDIEINNFKVNIISEGTKKIDINEDGKDDFGLGRGFYRSDTMLESYYFGIEPLDENIFIATSEILDTLFECKPTQGSGNSQTTTFNSLSPFNCNETMFLEDQEYFSEFYPKIIESNEIEFDDINWSNEKLTMSRCEKRVSSISGTVSIVHDFWINQNKKYIFFELREKTIQKGYLKLDSDESGSYRIYEIGLEDL